jgi:alpha-L-fucosidase
MGTPTTAIKISSLGKNSKLNDKSISSVKMLGSKEKLIWKQEDDALVINQPKKLPEWQVITFKIELKN